MSNFVPFQIVLNSMHRYQPRIHLVRLSPGRNIPTTPKELQELDHKTFIFRETVFTAVTGEFNEICTLNSQAKTKKWQIENENYNNNRNLNFFLLFE